jgi:hypothetical protein
LKVENAFDPNDVSFVDPSDDDDEEALGRVKTVSKNNKSTRPGRPLLGARADMDVYDEVCYVFSHPYS